MVYFPRRYTARGHARTSSGAACRGWHPRSSTSPHVLHTVRMDTIGGFTIERTLGHGGMGAVHLARALDGRQVVVKVVRPELAEDPAFRARLVQEVSAARGVSSPDVAQILYADPEGDPAWVATEYIAGPTLARRLLENGPMAEPDLRRLAAGLAGALTAIHACGLVHRDLKPANIILAEDGPRVVDFGLAYAVAATRLTYLGTAAGTAGFLAPEQVLGTDVTPAADVFAFGAVLAAAAGREPFGEGGPLSVLYRTVHEAPDLSALPESLRPVVADCLAKDAAARPSVSRLSDYFVGSPAAAAVPAPPVAAAPGYGLPTTPVAPGYGVPTMPVAPVAPVGPPQPPYPMPTMPAPAPAMPAPPSAMFAPGAAAPASAPKDNAFVAVDVNGAVSIDASGVLFQRQGAEFEAAWDQIAHITYALSPRGNRLLVSVFLVNGFQAHQEIDAKRQSERLRLVGQLETALFLHAGGRHMTG